MKTILLTLTLLATIWAKPSSRKLGFPHSRIINGEDATPGQFPHQISYQYGLLGSFSHVCGGSIISPTWILTAGHCVTGIPAFGEFKIIAGITDLYEENDERQEINVVDKIVHPDFNGEGVGANDVALLQLEKPLVFGDLVKPIALPEAGSEPSGDAVLSGWGAIGTFIIDIMPEILQTVTLPLLTYDECSTAIGDLLGEGEENPLSQESNVCASGSDGKSACSGDSGGPLIQDDVIVGVVSWGFTPCGEEGVPSVYTKVSNFIDFIKEHVTDLE